MRAYGDIIFSPSTAAIPLDMSFLDAWDTALCGAYLSSIRPPFPISEIRFRVDASDTNELYGRLFRAIFEQWKKRMPKGLEVHAIDLLLRKLNEIESKLINSDPAQFPEKIPKEGHAEVATAFFDLAVKKQLLTYSEAIDIPSGRYEKHPNVKMQTNNIENRIKEARNQLGLSQKEAADKWGFPVQTIQQWEQGRRKPRALYLEKIESILAECESKRKPRPGI